MTDDPQWHDEGGHEWLDSAAYSAYKGSTVDLTTRDGFGEFSYDNFFEVMDRYPDLGGFWIDNDNAYWESHNLYAQIYQKRPNYTISNNNEDTPIMDMISNEQKTGMTPVVRLPAGGLHGRAPAHRGRLQAALHRRLVVRRHRPGGRQKLTLGRLITNAGSSVKALMAETAQVNGKFPANQVAFNNFANGYLAPIWESLHGTEGGGYLYGGLQPGSGTTARTASPRQQDRPGPAVHPRADPAAHQHPAAARQRLPGRRGSPTSVPARPLRSASAAARSPSPASAAGTRTTRSSRSPRPDARASSPARQR